MKRRKLSAQLELVFPGEDPRLGECERRAVVELVARLIRQVASDEERRRHDGKDPARPSQS
jgi:hypothetical protein